MPYEDEHLLVVDKPAGLVVHPAAGHRGPTLAGALAGRAAGGDDPARAGHRAPPGPRHLGPDGGGEVRAGLRGAEGDDRRPRGRPALPRAGGGPPAVGVGHHRRAAGPRPPPARRCAPPTATARGRRSPTSPWSRTLPADHPPRRAPGDRAHPSDPRPPVRDRAPGVRRFGLRGRAMRTATWVNAPIPAQYPARVLSPHIGGTIFRASPNHPPICVAHSTQPGGSQSPEGQTETDRERGAFGRLVCCPGSDARHFRKLRSAGAFQPVRAGPPSPTSGGPAPSLDADGAAFWPPRSASGALVSSRTQPTRRDSGAGPARATDPGPAHARRESVPTREHRWQK